MSWRCATWLLAAALVGGCVRPAADRARADRRVGQLAADGVTFSVEAGLATLRAEAAGELRLWAQAPALRIEAASDPGAQVSWRVAADNILPGAVLTGLDGSGAPLVVSLLDRPGPTSGLWQVDLPAGQTSQITLSDPAAATDGPFRFGVVSDIQDALPRVDDIWRQMNGEGLAFVISAGDLTEHGEPDQLRRFQERMAGLQVPLFSAPGNHDVTPGDPGPWHRRFGRHSLHFAHRGVHFSLVDSASGTIDPIVYGWLDDWLTAAGDAPHVYVSHYPPLDPIGLRNGSFRSRNEAAKLLVILARGGVDLCLYGHVHAYYAFTNGGVPAYISGGGGAIEERLDGLGRHYLVVEAGPVVGVDRVQLCRVD